MQEEDELLMLLDCAEDVLQAPPRVDVQAGEGASASEATAAGPRRFGSASGRRLEDQLSPPVRRHGNLYELGVCRTAACARCHRLRVRCVFARNARACVRCCRRGDQCVPRVVVRKGETLGELRLQASKWPRLLLAGKGSPGEQFQAVRQLIKLSKALGCKQPPARLHYMCAHMFLAARELHSVPQLHAATCLAAALGIDSPMEWLDQPPRTASEEALAQVSEEVHARILVAPQDGACFIVRSNAGRSEVLVNSTFEYLFTSASMLVGHISAGQVPLVESWPRWLESLQDVQDFMGEMVEALVLGHASRGTEPRWQQQQPNHEKRTWSCTMSRRVELRDSSRALFEATLTAAGSFGDGGVCYAAGVCFRDLRPLNESAIRRWRAMCGSASPVTPPGRFRAHTDATSLDDAGLDGWLLDVDVAEDSEGSAYDDEKVILH